jgi:hypothetical protein
VRVFLAAYMIAYRPNHVFEQMGVLERQLYDSAVVLLERFDRICAEVKREGSFQRVDPALSSDFATLLFKYLVAFKKWKVPDEVGIVFDEFF